MLPTNEKAVSNQIYLNLSNKLFKSSEQTYLGCQKQHLYVVSDEEIKTGDWYLDLQGRINYPILSGHEYWGLRTDYKKIIATTDSLLQYAIDKSPYPMEVYGLPQPSQSFINKFISEYNKGNIIENVLVEYYECPFYKGQLKISNKDNTITIKRVKDSWNREELVIKIKEFAEKFVANTNTAYKQKDISDWIEQNL